MKSLRREVHPSARTSRAVCFGLRPDRRSRRRCAPGQGTSRLCATGGSLFVNVHLHLDGGRDHVKRGVSVNCLLGPRPPWPGARRCACGRRSPWLGCSGCSSLSGPARAADVPALPVAPGLHRAAGALGFLVWWCLARGLERPTASWGSAWPLWAVLARRSSPGRGWSAPWFLAGRAGGGDRVGRLVAGRGAGRRPPCRPLRAAGSCWAYLVGNSRCCERTG